jgi:hypothetical protein
MVGVACTHVAGCRNVEYCALEWRGAVLAIEDLLEKVDICRWDLHISCG